MTSQTEPAPAPQAILCADWGKDIRKRAVFVADVSSRSVRRAVPRAWSLAAVLEEGHCQVNENSAD